MQTRFGDWQWILRLSNLDHMIKFKIIDGKLLAVFSQCYAS